jgi:hypothetical protein
MSSEMVEKTAIVSEAIKDLSQAIQTKSGLTS